MRRGTDKRKSKNFYLKYKDDRYYYYGCKVCDKDTELNTTFKLRGYYVGSRLPSCRCSDLYGFDLNEYMVLLKRKLEPYGYKVLGICYNDAGKVTATSKVVLMCKIHNCIISSCTINALLCNSGLTPCKACRNSQKEQATLYKWKLRVFNSLERYKHKFINIDKSSISIVPPCPYRTKRPDYYVKFRCNKCSDLFNKGSYFLQTASKFVKGKAGCGCMINYNYSKDEYKELINNCSSDKYEFISWEDEDHVTAMSYFYYRCKYHGLMRARYWDWRGGCRCPLCAKTGFKRNKPAVLYLIRWTDVITGQTYIKYGISNNFKSRLSNLKKYAKVQHEVINIFHFKVGKVAENVETEIKRLFKDADKISKELLPDGWFETVTEYSTTLDSIKGVILLKGKFHKIT